MSGPPERKATWFNGLIWVQRELARQQVIWGEQHKYPWEWISVLAEELGETAKAANRMDETEDTAGWRVEYRDQVLHIAAVAVRALADFDATATTPEAGQPPRCLDYYPGEPGVFTPKPRLHKKKKKGKK